MAFCTNCGQELPVDAKACPNCGTTVEAKQATPAAPKQETKVNDFTAQFDPKDIADNKVMAILAYLSWLVLIPLLVSPAKDSPFVRFHVNQGLILFIASFIIGLIPCIGQLVCVILAVLGIVNAANGEAKELPIIGKFRLLK